ncbi:XRE family transcriptional regulator [Bradyrhizobium nanningense]|uniref:helix-turn-helix domain-containing protein n=1 Tax=Bradyrhizobium nanningense TaxID=1325118 RepID=UPI001008C98E|nr:helix-turn-helix domain-containing protein [Bradyrhizobium nanningense]RXH35248.1 XRE family transcriptional regulator [Bradyrhizobium nanningense]
MKSKNSDPAQFDVAALHAALDAERIARRLTWKDVSGESGVSASTLTRLSQGRRPDVDSLAALTQWLGLPADRFMGQRKVAFGAASPLTQISSILREDPNLNENAAAALDELIKATYARLRSQK